VSYGNFVTNRPLFILHFQKHWKQLDLLGRALNALLYVRQKLTFLGSPVLDFEY